MSFILSPFLPQMVNTLTHTHTQTKYQRVFHKSIRYLLTFGKSVTSLGRSLAVFWCSVFVSLLLAGSDSSAVTSLEVAVTVACCMCVFWCCSRVSRRANRCIQVLHWNGFSCVCVRECLRSLSQVENCLKHTSHANGFSPEWHLRCTRRVLRWENRFSHTWQLYGFSPVCTRRWICSLSRCANRFGQRSQWNGFSPVCVR